MQKKESNFDTDLFIPIINETEKILEVERNNKTDKALKIIADQKITSNISRSDKRHNSNKKHEEIHGDSEPLALPDGKEGAEEVILLPDGRKTEEIEEAEIITGDTKEEFLTEEEIKETQGEKEYSEEEKKDAALPDDPVALDDKLL